MVTCVGSPLGIITRANLESFLESSESFFVSQHSLVYELPKPAQLRRFVVSLHRVIL